MPPPNGTPARRRPTSTGTAAATSARPRRAPAAAAPPADARLECLAGPQSGSEYVLEGDEVVIGRAADNAISIPDTSVSRKHVLLRQTPEGWAASDMGSGNGTLVNGAAIAEETLLNDGDVITLGDTELKYVGSGGGAAARPAAIERRAPPGRPSRADIPVRASGSRPIVRSSRRNSMQVDPMAQQKKRKLMIRIGAVGMVLLAAGVGYKAWQAKQESLANSQRVKEQTHMEELRAMNQEAKNLVREGKWQEAKARFEELMAKDSQYGSGINVQDYLKRAEKEIPNQEHLAAGQAAIASGKIGVAFKELEQVTNDTLQSEQRDKLRTAVESKIDQGLNDARGLLGSTGDRAKMEQLKNIAEDILVARPEHRDALEYKKTADAAIDRIDHPPAPIVEPKRPWLAVQQTFKDGDQTGAFALAQKCESQAAQCKQLVQQIREFGEKYKKLESLSPSELSALLDLDRRITGGGLSSMARPIVIRASASYLKTASSAKATGNWARAAEFAKKVLSGDPGNVEAQSILNECNNHAKEIYMRGYSVKESDPDEAQKLFRQVVEMTPNDSEYHQKAQRWLKGGND